MASRSPASPPPPALAKAPSPSSPTKASPPTPSTKASPPPNSTKAPPPRPANSTKAPPPSISTKAPPPSRPANSTKAPPPSISTKAPPPPPPANSTKAPSPSISTNAPPPKSKKAPPPRSTPSSPIPSHSPPKVTTKAPPPPNNRRSAHPSPPRKGGSSVPPVESDSTVPMGLVIGIAVASVAVLALLSFLLWCCCRKRKRGYHGSSGYYIPPVSPGSKAEDPYYSQQHWQHNLPPSEPAFTRPNAYSSAAVAALPPQPSLRMPAPPPPRHFMSSGGSVSNYSESEAPHQEPSLGMALSLAKSTFTCEELAMATDGFSNANLLGQGGFGFVHRGVLPNGKEFAVKQLKAGSGQGEREFQAEVEIISRVHHRHLVSLIGYCITGSQRMLVYEYVPNNTLEFHLHGKGRPTMDWPTRLKIALGSAKGLAYLHEDCHPKIIHRDIKASNILLDFKFEAKVADFGLAKFTSDVNTHVSTRVMGTFGYMAPEYASSGKLTDKSDVFSFGVMLLELITGRKPVDSTNKFMDGSLVDWARPLLLRALEDGDFDAIADEQLHHVYNLNEMVRMAACAAACVRHSARRRPKLSQIVRALEGDMSLTDLNDGIRPGEAAVDSSYESSDYDTRQYNEDVKRFRKMAEYGDSSEYSGATSEYSLNRTGSSSEARPTAAREMEMGGTRRGGRAFSRNA